MQITKFKCKLFIDEELEFWEVERTFLGQMSARQTQYCNADPHLGFHV